MTAQTATQCFVCVVDSSWSTCRNFGRFGWLIGEGLFFFDRFPVPARVSSRRSPWAVLKLAYACYSCLWNRLNSKNHKNGNTSWKFTPTPPKISVGLMKTMSSLPVLDIPAFHLNASIVPKNVLIVLGTTLVLSCVSSGGDQAAANFVCPQHHPFAVLYRWVPKPGARDGGGELKIYKLVQTMVHVLVDDSRIISSPKPARGESQTRQISCWEEKIYKNEK